MAFPPPSGPEDERRELVDFMGTKYPFPVLPPQPVRFDPAKARVDLLRQGLLSLPAEQRAAGQATLERMLSGGTAPGPLGSIVAALEDNRLGDAYAVAARTQPTTKYTPGLAQVADSGPIASNADPGIASKATPTVSDESERDDPTDPLAHSRALMALIEAVGRADAATDLAALDAEIDRVLADDPESAARFKQQARQFALHGGSRDREGLPMAGFSDWAGDEGYYAARAVVRAGEEARAAGYEVTETGAGRIALSLPGDVPFVELETRLLADLPLVDEDGKTRFRLDLDVLSGRIPREEAIAIAKQLDPDRTYRMLRGYKAGQIMPVPSQTAAIVGEAYDALDEGADSRQIEALLRAGLFEKPGWQVLAELLIAASPLGTAIDAVDFADATLDLKQGLADGDEEKIGAARDRMILAGLGFLPVGKLGKLLKIAVKGGKAAAREGIALLRTQLRAELHGMANAMESDVDRALRYIGEDPAHRHLAKGFNPDEVADPRLLALKGDAKGQYTKIKKALSDIQGKSGAKLLLEVVPLLHPGSNVMAKDEVFVRVTRADGSSVITDIDVLVLPKDSALAADIAAERIGTDKTPIDLDTLLGEQPIASEVKTGRGRRTEPQKLVRDAFAKAAKPYTLARVPIADIPIRRIRRDLLAFAQRKNLDPAYVLMVARSLKKVLPSDTPFLSALFAGLSILGLAGSGALDDEKP